MIDQENTENATYNPQEKNYNNNNNNNNKLVPLQ
jgi:hypothetical protein